MTHGLTHSINHIIHTQRHQHIANKDNTMHQINIFVFPWSCTMEFQTRNANSSQSFPAPQSQNKCSNVAMCAFAFTLFMLCFRISLFTWHQMKHKTKHDYKLMMFETQIKCHLLHDLVMAIVASMFLSPQKHSNVPECTKQQKGHGQRSSNKKDSPHCFPALMVFVLFKHWNNVSFLCLNTASSACTLSMLPSMVVT